VGRVSGELLTVASLNTRGIPLTGSQLAERYAAIGAGFDAGDADVVCCQEVFTYAGEVTVESAALVFAEKEPLGYVSDHIGLRVRLSLTASTPGRGRFARP
jgi:hypothetical protein